jgi:glycosyltransferase involved in cell wall biosynthesis
MYVGRSSFQIARDFGDRLARLADEGFEVHVLAGADGGFEELADRGLSVKDLPVGRPGNVAGLAGSFFILQAYFIERRPLLVHGFDDLVAWIAALAADRVDVPGIFATVGRHHFGGERAGLASPLRLYAPELVERLEGAVSAPLEQLASRGWQAFYRHLGSMVDKYIVSNERDYDVLETRQLVPARKLELLIGGRGVDVERFNPDADEMIPVGEARRAVGLPEAWRQVVGYAGPARPDAGGADLLRAIDRIGDRRRDTGWLVAVDEQTPEAMRRRLAERADQGLVHLHEGAVDPTFFRALDLYAAVDHADAEGRRPMEAQAMRVPVVAYRTAEYGSVVADGQTGRLVEAGDVDGLVGTLLGLFDDPKKVRDFGRRARARSTKRFDRQHVENQVLRLNDALLEEKITEEPS